MKKSLAIITLCIGLFSHMQAAEILWLAGTHGYTIPDDGNIYYTNYSYLGEPLTVNGVFEVRSNTLRMGPGVTTSMEINGTVLVYNGAAINIFKASETPTNLNINHSGKLFLFGGQLVISNAGCNINVNQGGSLYNYHGTIYNLVGTFNVNFGGHFHNVRGNILASYNLNSGCIFTNSDKAELDCDIFMGGTWTPTEKATFDGNGNHITLGSTGGIFVLGPDASLQLSDITFNNVSNNKIRCSDNSTTLSIHNNIWNLDNTYNFTWGKLNVTGDWTISSSRKQFTHSSDDTSYINSTLHFKDTIFEYASTRPDALQFADSNSILHLENSKVVANTPFTPNTGTLQTSGDIIIFNSLLGGGAINEFYYGNMNINIGGGFTVEYGYLV